MLAYKSLVKATWLLVSHIGVLASRSKDV